MPIVDLRDVSKSFGTSKVLDGVSLTIRTGERVGLVGTNGAGKSTLARILAGIEAPDAGTVARRRGAEVAYLAQEPTFDDALTARQVVEGGLGPWSEARTRHDEASARIAAGGAGADAALADQAHAAADVERLGGWTVAHRVEAMLGHLGLARPDAPFGTLSGGDRRRVALARILVAQPALAVLDEPSNHLDLDTVEWLETFLVDEYQGAVLLITHDRFLLDHVVTRTVEVEGGAVHIYEGGYEAYLEAKADRLAHMARTEQNRQNFLRTELEWLRRQPKARSTKQKARIQRAESAKGQSAPKAERVASLALDATRTGKTVLELRGLRLEVAGRVLVDKLDLIVVPGDRIGIVGKNGTGKTTLVRAILGEHQPAAGEVVLGKQARIAYFDQHRRDLDDEKSVFENVAGDRAFVDVAGATFDARGYLERFLFDGQKQRQPVGSLSGGERARVALAKILSRGSNLVLFDEPTNDLDVATLGALEELLTTFEGTAIVVTHDRWFLNRVATSILAFEGDGRVVRHAGNYDDYRARRAAELEAAAPEPTATRPAARSAPPAAGPRPLTYAERIELDKLPDAIEAADAAVAKLEGDLGDPALYVSRGSEVPALHASLAKARTTAAELLARWEELETRRDATRR